MSKVDDILTELEKIEQLEGVGDTILYEIREMVTNKDYISDDNEAIGTLKDLRIEYEEEAVEDAVTKNVLGEKGDIHIK